MEKNENGEDHRNSNSIPEIAFPSMDLLKHGLSVYTIEVYNIFEQEIIDGASCNYEEVQSNILGRMFRVWLLGEQIFHHTVIYNKAQGIIECSRKMFTEVGILCKHCLRVMHACCVANIPEKYLRKRWCKTIEECQSNELIVGNARK